MVAALVYFSARPKEVIAPVTDTSETTEPVAKSPGANAPAVHANAPVKRPAPRTPDISLAGEARPFPDNPNRWTYTMWLKAPEEVTEDISHVHYDLVLASEPLSLDGNSAAPFSASYYGHGCYDNVVVTVSFKSESQPFKKRFNLCDALKGVQ
jgi:hypothetical protein